MVRGKTMTESGSHPREASQFLESLESLAKVGAASILVLYVLGLLAINGYLFSLGATDFSLVRPRFVYTGGLIVSCAVLFTLLPVYMFNVERNSWPTTLRMFLAFTGFLTASGLVFNLLLYTSEGRQEFAPALTSTLVLYGITVPCAFLLWIPVAAYFRIRDKWGTLRVGRLVAVALLCLLAIGIFVIAFMILLFPKIPIQFGGGKPANVVLLIKKDEVDGVQALGVPFSDEDKRTSSAGKPSSTKSAVTKPLDLMYEGSELYVIRVDGSTLLRLNRDLVLGVRVHRSVD
jgi:hypothetical protein